MRDVGGGVAGLVRSATVAVVSGATREVLGSGFFVAPGVVVTCAHVVAEAPGPLRVLWGDALHDVTAQALDPVEAADGASYPSPDTAVLTVAALLATPYLHPCVPLTVAGTQPDVDDVLQVFGYTRVRTGMVELDSSTPKFVSRVGERDELFKLAGGQIAPGMSGGPVLNATTRAVCAMAKSTLDQHSDIGGWAVPIDDVLAVGDAKAIRAANLAAFDDSLPAMRAAQAGFGTLPLVVAERIRSAAPALVVELARLGVKRPSWVADDDLAEWVARQLFARNFDELVDLVAQTAVVLGSVTTDVLEAVSCCLPSGDGETSGWVPADAAEALRLEWNRERPRVLRLSSDHPDTPRHVLRRALHRQVPILSVLPTSAEPGPEGVPAQLITDIEASLQNYFNIRPSTWKAARLKMLAHLRRQNHVARLDPGVLTDAKILAAVIAAFGGLRFIVCSRDYPPPPGADDVILNLRPPIDPIDEEIVLGILATFSAGNVLGRIDAS